MEAEEPKRFVHSTAGNSRIAEKSYALVRCGLPKAWVTLDASGMGADAAGVFVGPGIEVVGSEVFVRSAVAVGATKLA